MLHMLACTLLALSFAPALYGVEPGNLKITTVDREIARNGRSRPIEYRATFPTTGGPYPLILFSHGWLGSRQGYEPLATHWASHGYVVIQPTFTDSFQYLSPSERRNALNTQGGRSFSNWDERVEDVKFLIANLQKIHNAIPQLKGKVDKDRLGIGGHSFGSNTSILLGGGGPEQYDQPGADALLLISPQGASRLVTPRSIASIGIPTLSITGSNDTAITNTAPEDRKDPFKHASPGDKYLLWIEDAHHGFGGISGPRRFPTSGPSNENHVDYVKSSTLAFWDAYLKSSTRAKTYLQTNGIGKETKGEADLQKK